MKESARYVKIVEWSDEDQCFVGSCPGVFYGGCQGDDESQVFAELCEIVVLYGDRVQPVVLLQIQFGEEEDLILPRGSNKVTGEARRKQASLPFLPHRFDAPMGQGPA